MPSDLSIPESLDLLPAVHCAATWRGWAAIREAAMLIKIGRGFELEVMGGGVYLRIGHRDWWLGTHS
jgi:hypothetical protein